MKRYLPGLFLILPTIILLGALILVPVIYSARLSLSKMIVSAGKTTYVWVGLKNYLYLFTDRTFHQVVIQTIVFSASTVIGTLILGLAIALLLNQTAPGVGVVKVLFLLPWCLPYVVNAVMWSWIYHGSYGVLNAVLLKVGLIGEYKVWLAEPETAMIAIVVATIWKAVPFAALMLMASLKSVPKDLTDAAKVDGCGTWGCFVHIVLPHIKPVLLVLIVLETMWSLKAFDLIWVLTQGGPFNKTMVLNAMVYQLMFYYFRFGSAAAAAWILTGATLVLTLVYQRLLKLHQEMD